MRDNISVRQWQELYRAGGFEKTDPGTLGMAGWSDFHLCLENRRLPGLVKMALSITHPFVLDNYHVYFVGHTPAAGPEYSSACFAPLAGRPFQLRFSVDLDSPFQREKWALFTQRYGEGEAEAVFSNVRSLIRYIHTMAHELEHDIKPAFWEEAAAAKQFLFEHDGLVPGALRREGKHRYSCWIRGTNARRFIHVVRHPEDIPSEFRDGGAVLINGMFVCCSEDMEVERVLEHPAKSERHSPKGRKRRTSNDER